MVSQEPREPESWLPTGLTFPSAFAKVTEGR